MTPAQFHAAYMGMLIRMSFGREYDAPQVGIVTQVGNTPSGLGWVEVHIRLANGSPTSYWIPPDNDPDNWHIDLPGEEHP